MRNLYQMMYKLINEEKSFYITDKVLEASIDNIKTSMGNIVSGPVTELLRDLKAVDYDNVIGFIYLSAESGDNNPSVKIIEKRVIGRRNYYLFIVISTLTKDEHTSIDEEINSIDHAVKVDMYSRLLDYYLDIFNSNNRIMKYLNSRDSGKVEDPLVVIAKAIILANSDIGKEIFDIEDKDDSTRLFHIMDKYITPNLRTDWILSQSIKSADKANAFSLQILLKQEIYNLCLSIRNDDIQKEKTNFIDLFVNGDIYKLSEYPTISLFVAHGSTAFSTKELNTYWSTFI